MNTNNTNLNLISINILTSCGNKTDVVPCQPGSYAPQGHMSCIPCPVASYCPTSKLPAHIPCSNVTTAVTQNKTSCDLCPPGYKCINAAQSPVPCDNGYYSKGGASECTICPAGHR